MTDKKRKSDAPVYPIFAKKTKQDDPPFAVGPSNTATTEPNSAQAELKPLSLTEFAALLDFSSVDTEEEIAIRFDRIAKALLHEFRLVARQSNGNETEFEVMEAEFYLQVEGCHEDPFTHGSEEQKVSGRWYFHRAPRRSEDSTRSLTSSTAYRGGSRKGMDLTLGGAPLAKTSKSFASPNPSSTATELAQPAPATQLLRGGILLRSLRQLGPGSKIISGPSLLVDQILSVSGASSIEDLVENKWEKSTSAVLTEEEAPPSCLYLKPVESTTTAPDKSSPTIYFSPRIGLDLSHPGTTGPSILPIHPRLRFLVKRYRFFVHPEQLVANGRTQTFLGVLQSRLETASSIENGLKKPYLSDEIARLTGMKQPTAAKYLAEYLAGRKAGAEFLKSVIGPKGKGASGAPATYLKMIGALSTLQL